MRACCELGGAFLNMKHEFYNGANISYTQSHSPGANVCSHRFPAQKMKKAKTNNRSIEQRIKKCIVLTLGLRVGTSVTGLDVVVATTGEADGMSEIGFRVGGSY